MAKILVTSALPYVNNIPHLGNLIGSTLSADVFSRHKRLQGHEVLYVCGADEHGTMTEIKAKEEGVSCQELCDKYGAIHKQIYDWFGISFDVWGRTHTTTQETITQEIFLDLYKNGYIIEQEVEQLYDEKAQQYLSDRFVEGQCPFCGAQGARGDQCDACQKLIHAPDLKNPISKLTGTTPVIKKTKHLFIDLPKLTKKLKPWIAKHENKWSKNTSTITKEWLANIKPRAITRDLKWGVPVPLNGYEEKVFYVWFDAPIGYISITAHARDDWKNWWQNDAVALTQFMGKDNIVFHSVIFPATLLGTQKPWTLVDTINTTEFLNMEKGKFSKSKKTGIFGDDCIELEKEYGIPADVWRYYLLCTRPETADATFSWSDFAARTNNELIANLANLVHRTLHFAHTKLQGITPAVDNDLYTEFAEELGQLAARAHAHLDAAELRAGLQTLMHASKNMNAHFQQLQPWNTLKLDKEKAAGDILILLHALRDLATLLTPYLPHTAEKIHCMLGVKKQTYKDIGNFDEKLLARVIEPKVLFTKIEDELRETLEKRFLPTTINLDLRIAKILEAKPHPNADKLYVLQLDLGDEKRQLVAGLRAHYTPEELTGTAIIIVANLAPAKLRGEISQGMLLASENEQGTVGLLRPKGALGTQLTIGGQRAQQQITFDDFLKHQIRSSKEEVTVDGKAIDCEIVVDKHAYGKVR